MVASNAAQRLRARFDRWGAHVRGGGVGLGLTLDSVGAGRSPRSLAGVAPSADANRVLYAYPGVSESFVNGPLGLEQRFTVVRAPAGGGPLTLSLSLSGNVHARVIEAGKGLVLTDAGRHVLDYRGLAAVDARGRALHAWLSVLGSRVLVRVDARGAHYPVSIDPLIQQGPPLTDLAGEGEVGDGAFGARVAVSSDGSTVLVGGPREYHEEGAAFVFVRSGSTWSQQAELIADCTSSCANQGTGESGKGEFGQSVALSADGDTAAIGAGGDGGYKGAVWVFARSGSSWSEQTKLVADCATSCANQGTGERSFGIFGQSIALSSDGNTLIAGAPYDETSEGAYYEGAAWVFTRSGSTWSEQATLVGDCTSSCAGEGSGESTYGYFGDAVALAGDGNTAVLGASDNESGVGASWVFTRSGSSWSEDAKLVGAGESGSGEFGNSVAVSEDGGTALIAGAYDNSGNGAVWVFTSSGSSWSEQAKLVGDCTSSCAGEGTGESGSGEFGRDAALSADGSTAVVGAPFDEGGVGAAWVFKRSGSSWTQDGAKLVADCTTDCEDEGTGEVGDASFGYGVAISPDASTVMVGAPSYYEFQSGVWAFTPVSTATISNGPTSGVSQSGCTFAITGEQASLNVGTVEGCLRSEGNATITDDVPSSSIDVTSPIAGPESSSLTLDSTGSISQSAPIAIGTVKASAPAGVVLTDQGNEVSSFEGNAEEDGEVEVADSCGLNVTGVDADAPNGWDRVANASFDLASATALAGRAAAQAQSSSCGSPKLTQAQDGKIASVKVKASAPAGVVLTDQGNEVSSFEGNAEEDGEVEVADSCGLNVTGVDADAPNGWDRVANASFDLASATALAGRAAAQAQSSSCGSPKLTQAQDGKIASVKVKASAPAGVVLTDQGNEVSSFEGNAEEDGEVEVADSCGLNVTGVDADAPNGWDRVANASFDLASATALAGRAAAQAQSSSCGSPKLTQAQDGKIASVKVKASAPAGVVLTDQGNEVSSFEGNAEEDGNVELEDASGSLAVTKAAPHAGWDTILGVKGTAPMGSAPGLTLKGPVSGADVVLKGDQMKLSGGSVTATGTAKLAPASPSQPIDLGAPRPDALSLVAADIDAVSAAKLVVGGATAGPVTVSAAIAPTKTDSLTLQTPAAVEGAGKGSLSVPQLALDDVGHAHTWTITPTTVAQGTSRALPYAGVTELTLEGEGGGDTVDATASASTTYSLDGGPSSDGILDYNAAGRPVSGSTSPPSGTIDSPGVAPVAFTRMASVNIANGHASLPLLGRCVTAPPLQEGHFGRCVEYEHAKYTYDFLAGAAKDRFTGVLGATTLEGVNKTRVRCASGSAQGEYEQGTKLAVTLTLSGCERPTSHMPCEDVGGPSGQISTSELEGEYGFITRTPKLVVGIDLRHEPSLASFECETSGPGGKEMVALEGSVIGRIAPVDVMKGSFTVVFSQSKGIQALEAFEGGGKDTLSSSVTGGASGEPTGLAGKITITNEEPLELKAELNG